MATLAEAGLSSNLGIEDGVNPQNELAVAVIHNAMDDIYAWHDRMGSAFALPVSKVVDLGDETISLGRPHGSTETFRQPLFRSLQPVFAEKYSYSQDYQLTGSTIVDDPEVALVNDREELEEIIRSDKRRADRRPVHILVGGEAVKAFIGSALATLDIRGDNSMDFDNEGFRMLGDDLIASRLIQLAGIGGISISSAIPPAHTERAVNELVTTTLIGHYFSLAIEENIGWEDGRWKVACKRFARSYGIEAGEIADVAMIFRDQIYATVTENQARRGHEVDWPILEESVALHMAEYLIGDRSA